MKNKEKCICSAHCSHECVCDCDWWNKLTDDEIMNLYTSHYNITGNIVLKEDYEFVRKVEQALKEKNP